MAASIVTVLVVAYTSSILFQGVVNERCFSKTVILHPYRLSFLTNFSKDKCEGILIRHHISRLLNNDLFQLIEKTTIYLTTNFKKSVR